MRAQSQDEKQAKAQEKEKLQTLIAARQKAESIQAEYEARLKALQDDSERKQMDLSEAMSQVYFTIDFQFRFRFQTSFSKIGRLEDELRKTQAAKDELERGRHEIQLMMKTLEESKNMEAEEKERLREEIRIKQAEVQNISDQVSSLISFLN